MPSKKILAVDDNAFAVGLAALMIAAQRSRRNPKPEKSYRLVIHEHRIYAWKTDGGRTLTIKPPCGCAAFEEESPPLRGGVWTSELTCPHCGQTFMCSRTPNRYAIPGA